MMPFGLVDVLHDTDMSDVLLHDLHVDSRSVSTRRWSLAQYHAHTQMSSKACLTQADG